MNANLFKRTKLVYGLLLAGWAMVVAWQIVEHGRVTTSARTALINRSRDITATLGLVIRSQRRWGGVSQERIESALKELVKSDELSSVELLNASGEVVASAGTPIDLEAKGMMQVGEHWDRQRVTLVNLIDLGATLTPEGETNRPIIVFPRRDPGSPPRVEGPPNDLALTNIFLRRGFPDGPREEDRPRPRAESGTNMADSSNGSSGATAFNRAPPRRPPGGPRSRRPPGMSEAEYESLLERRGLHGLVLAMSTEGFRRICVGDLWVRTLVACFASMSGLGLGLAWRNLAKSSELQMRLLRASELNTHLKGMNLAAAGLAHETRNPLNIIRGLAQLISKQSDASTEIRARTREIIEETDRVTSQLNDFINYSRPREVRRSAVLLNSVVGEVVRALKYDIEEKNIRLTVAEDRLTVEADEQLLRQALFNLLLNATQVVEPQGEIQIVAGKSSASEAFIEVCDNGPGVSREHRTDVFKPYFTTQEKGTGLGLAVVQQIVLAHGWEIECLPHEPKGAIFRISHLKPVARA